MPRYIVFRTVGKLSEEEIEAAVRAATEVSVQMSGLTWIHAYYSVEEGKIYCEYEAPSAELCFEHSRRAGLPFDHAEVVRHLEPSMFR